MVLQPAVQNECGCLPPPSLPLTFIKMVSSSSSCLWSCYSQVGIGSIGMMTGTSATAGYRKRCLNHSKVSKPQQTFNYYSASRRHVRKSAAGPVALQIDEIELKIALWLAGLWWSEYTLLHNLNHKCCCFNKQAHGQPGCSCCWEVPEEPAVKCLNGAHV